jgi:hypothetical protein
MIDLGSRFTRTTDLKSYANRARSNIMARKWFGSTALYTFVTMLLFALFAFGAGYLTDQPFLLIYTSSQIIFLLIGILHAAIIYDVLDWLDKETFWKGGLMTLFFWLAGMGAIYLLKYFPYTKTVPSLTITILFTLPLVFRWTMRYFSQIPFKIYKAWYYPLGQAEPDTDLIDLSKILVIQFEFPKLIDDTRYTNFTAKAPVNMSVGQLFFIFINEYNYRNDKHLQYLDEDGNPYGWVFHKKVAWYKKRSFFDPDATFRENFVQNNDVLVATRTVTIR